MDRYLQDFTWSWFSVRLDSRSGSRFHWELGSVRRLRLAWELKLILSVISIYISYTDAELVHSDMNTALVEGLTIQSLDREGSCSLKNFLWMEGRVVIIKILLKLSFQTLFESMIVTIKKRVANGRNRNHFNTLIFYSNHQHVETDENHNNEHVFLLTERVCCK